MEDKHWIGASLTFVHFLRDDADNILTVHVDKYVDFDSEVYKTNSDIYEEQKYVSERYEESIMETGNLRSEVESENSDDSEMDNEYSL